MSDILIFDEDERNLKLQAIADSLEVDRLISENETLALAVSAALTSFFNAAKEGGIPFVITDVDFVINVFKSRGCFPPDQDLQSLGEFAKMLFWQFRVTADVGAPLHETLNRVIKPLGDSGFYESAQEGARITDQVRSRISLLAVTADMRDRLDRWITVFEQASAMSLERATAYKWLSDLLDDEDEQGNQGKGMRARIEALDLSKRLLPGMKKMDVQFVTMFYELAADAIGDGENFSMRDAAQLMQKFIDAGAFDIKKQFQTISQLVALVKTVYWRAFTTHAAGFALPPFAGGEKAVVMAIANESNSPLDAMNRKLKALSLIIEDPDLVDPTMVDELNKWGNQFADFLNQTTQELSQPATFANRTMRHIDAIARGIDHQEHTPADCTRRMRAEIPHTLIARFGSVLTFHGQAIRALGLTNDDRTRTVVESLGDDTDFNDPHVVALLLVDMFIAAFLVPKKQG